MRKSLNIIRDVRYNKSLMTCFKTPLLPVDRLQSCGSSRIVRYSPEKFHVIHAATNIRKVESTKVFYNDEGLSASEMFTKWLKGRQQGSHQDRSACDTDSRSDNKNPEGHHHANNGSGQAMMINRGELFPARLALALGMAKTLLGVLLVAFGALALWEQASMAYLGSGIN